MSKENRIEEKLKQLSEEKPEEEVREDLKRCRERAIAEINDCKAFVVITLGPNGVSGGHAGRLIDVVKCASCIPQVENDIKKTVVQSLLKGLGEDIAESIVKELFDGPKKTK